MINKSAKDFCPVLCYLLLCCFLLTLQNLSAAGETEQSKAKKEESQAKREERVLADQKQQDQILRDEVLGFVRKNFDRQAGEGWLFLARHYRELKEPDRSLLYLRTLLRSDNISPSLTWEALLLNAEIHDDRKDHALALKDLEKLLAMLPARSYLVRAKLARAKILGRNLTAIKDVYAALSAISSHFRKNLMSKP